MHGKTYASNNVSFESITTTDGLIQNTVHSIIQDHNGFIWIGTEDGLNRYDGRRFVPYIHISNDSTSLSDNFIEVIYEDHNGNIWLGTRNGLNIYDEVRNTFIHVPLGNFSKNIYTPAITEDVYGNMWVGTDGSGLLKIRIDSSGNRLTFNVSQFLNETTDSTTIPSNTVFSLETDLLHNLWIGTESGLCKLPASELNSSVPTTHFEHILIYLDNKCLLNKERVSEIVNHGSCIWVGTKGKLIFCLNYGAGNNNDWSLIRTKIKPTIPDAITVVTSMVFDGSDNLWVTYGEDGLSKISFENGYYVEEPYRHEKAKLNSLLSGPCLTVMKDRTSMLWIGTLNGISLLNPTKERFSAKLFPIIEKDTTDFITQAFYLERNRYYFFGTSITGLFIFDNQSKHTYRIHSMSKLDIFSIKKDDKGNFWIGTNAGLAFIKYSSLFIDDGRTQTINSNCEVRFYKKNEADPDNSIQSNLVFTLAQDHNGRIWIGTGQGLSGMDISTGKIKRVNLNPNNLSLFDERIIRHLLVDAENHLWIATDGGLFQYNLSTNIFKRIYGGNSDTTGLPSQRIICLHSDFRNRLWVGTNGGGICYYNAEKNTFHSYSQNDGLASSVVHSIQSDPSGNLWIGTNKGISRFNPEKKTATNYDSRDGLAADHFNETASMITADGFLFFGGIKGFNCFHPDSIHMNSLIPPVVLTDFKLIDKSILIGNPQMRELILSGQPLTFNHEENNFSFEFAALNFINTQKNQYAVMLEGFDKNWVNLGSRNYVSYTNMNPGNYTLRVKASNNDNVWNETGISLPILIKAPFYRYWWFKILLALAVALLIYIYYREHIKNIENRKEKEIALHQTQLKEQFLANMSHEIRTPLNAIMGMTRLLKEKNPKPDQLKYLNAITQSSDHLLVLINDILDFSKIEAGKIELENIPFNVYDAIHNVHTTLRFKAEEKGLTFSVRISPEVPKTVLGDPVRLAQVLINLAGNAIKFTSKGSVMITCSAVEINKKQSKLSFNVIDTGVGIAEESIGKIFESFTQENSSVNREFGGTGLGLAISKRLIEMQGGSLDVSSVKGEGSTFNVSVPFTIAQQEVEVAIVETVDPDIRRKMVDLKILLVDDNHFNQLVAIDTLELELTRANIDVAENGEEAIRLVNENNYDIVLMDVQMPVMNGLEATRAIRKLSAPKNQTRIIAMTASAMKTEVERCFAAGMDDFVAKPFNTVELLKKMSRLVVRLKVVA